MIVGVSGSRKFQDYDTIKQILDMYDITKMHVGDCAGVDALSIRYCRENNIQCEIFRANWTKYGRGAGPIRNAELLRGVEFLVAFPGPNSVGTFNCVRLAEINNISKDLHYLST